MNWLGMTERIQQSDQNGAIDLSDRKRRFGKFLNADECSSRPDFARLWIDCEVRFAIRMEERHRTGSMLINKFTIWTYQLNIFGPIRHVVPMHM
jgi:hypothetical protein